MPQFKKKPVVVEAVEITADWFEGDIEETEGLNTPVLDRETKTVTISTLEGDMTAGIGDWIITGVRGERYPCRGDIFLDTYELVPDPYPTDEYPETD